MGAHCTRKQIRMLIVAKRNNTGWEWSLSIQPPSTYWARHSQSSTPSPSLNVVFAYVHKRFVAQIFYKVIYVWNTHSQSSEKQSSEKGVQFLFLQFRLPQKNVWVPVLLLVLFMIWLLSVAVCWPVEHVWSHGNISNNNKNVQSNRAATGSRTWPQLTASRELRLYILLLYNTSDNATEWDREREMNIRASAKIMRVCS